MNYYLGIDGGGTVTTAVVTDENGNILVRKTGKTINFYSVGIEKARENLQLIINDITDFLGEVKFEGAFIGCSALDKKADKKIITALCENIINAQKTAMHSDLFIALNSLGNVSCPAVAVCGTGSMAMGKKENGETLISGGWGHIIGDEGSAYSITVSVLKNCCLMCDKKLSSPVIDEAKKYFNITDFRKIIDVIYLPHTSKAYIAGFAEKVSMLCNNGDTLCQNIIEAEAKAFAETVKSLLAELKQCRHLGIYGGVFKNNEYFTACFRDEIIKSYPYIKIQLLTIPPEECAARLAREL